jgi:hypothetical protein
LSAYYYEPVYRTEYTGTIVTQLEAGSASEQDIRLCGVRIKYQRLPHPLACLVAEVLVVDGLDVSLLWKI